MDARGIAYSIGLFSSLAVITTQTNTDLRTHPVSIQVSVERVRAAHALHAAPLMQTKRQNPALSPLLSREVKEAVQGTQEHVDGFRIPLPV